jgi:hypothetical protein
MTSLAPGVLEFQGSQIECIIVSYIDIDVNPLKVASGQAVPTPDRFSDALSGAPLLDSVMANIPRDRSLQAV